MVSVLTGLNQLSVQGKYKRLGQTDYTGALYRFIHGNSSTALPLGFHSKFFRALDTSSTAMMNFLNLLIASLYDSFKYNIKSERDSLVFVSAVMKSSGFGCRWLVMAGYPGNEFLGLNLMSQ